MTQTFKKNIHVPGTSLIHKLNISGKKTINVTYVETNPLDLTNAFLFAGDNDNFVAVTSQASDLKSIYLPNPQENDGRMVWVMDAAHHAGSALIDMVYPYGPDQFAASLNQNDEFVLLLATKYFDNSYKFIILKQQTFTDFA